MKKIQKYWGIALIVMLLASMLVMASPAAAGDLTYTLQGSPSNRAGVLQLAGSATMDVVDMAIAGDGTTIYAVSGTTPATTLYKSTNAGVTWTAITIPISATQVAVAPDDPNLVIIADATSCYVSQTGATLPFASTSLAAGVGMTAINDIAISPAVLGSYHYLTVAGVDGGGAEVAYFNLGATIPTWTETVTDWTGPSANGTSGAYAVAFSPNFASDFTALAVTLDATGNVTYLEQVNFNSSKWNTFGSPYPQTVASAVDTIESAAIAMAPDYLGADEVMRVNFVTLAYTDTAAAAKGLLHRYNDGIGTVISNTVQFNSVAFDGTNLVAGAYTTNDVYRSANPLAPVAISLLPARSFKKVGLDETGVADKVLVGFAGGNVVAAKSGTNSCFSVSRDLGLTFNDISLMDTTMSAVDDLAVSPDGVNRYLVTRDNTNTATSVFRYKDGAWERVLILGDTNGYIARPAPDNMDAIYVADIGATSIYYSSEAGNTRWYQRAASGNIADIAVENANIIYVGVGANVVKSTNGGFTWGVPSNAVGFAGNVQSIKVISAGNILVSSASGSVSYSTDGAATWVSAFDANGAGSGAPVYVEAAGLAAGDNIFAVSTGDTNIYRWTIGTNIATWDTMAWLNNLTYTSVDLALSNGTLYTFSVNGTDSLMGRTLNPNLPASILFLTEWDTEAVVATPGGAKLPIAATAPDTIKVSAGNTFWFISGATTYSYKDTFAPASAAPVPGAPANEYLVPVNSNGTAAGFTFSWAPVTGATGYELSVALDAAFTQRVGTLSNNALLTPFSVVNPNVVTPGVTYYWRVRANAPVLTPWSETWMFKVQPSQAMVPVLSSPANGGTIDMTSPGFSWTPISGASSYKFEISTNAAFATTIYTDEVYTAGAQLPITIELEKGKQYFWRVKALAPVEGDWSTVGNFFVAAEVVTPTPTATQPQITITTQPAPTIILPSQTVTTFTVAPPVTEEITPAWIWAIIVIGAILVIAMIVLIVRTRRSV